MRLVGRVLLWGCVLLLLIRGLGTVLADSPASGVARRGAVVTVTVPAARHSLRAKER
jgi:hypothetical protein